MTHARKGLLTRFRRDEKGAMAAEFVLVMPLFLMMVLFGIEAGRFLYSRAELSYALHATSRDAMLGTMPSKTELTDRMAQRFSILQRDQLETLDVTEAVNPDRTRWVTIDVSYRFEFLLPALVGKEFIALTGRDRFLRD